LDKEDRAPKDATVVACIAFTSSAGLLHLCYVALIVSLLSEKLPFLSSLSIKRGKKTQFLVT